MAYKAHNQMVLDSLRPGDRVEFERTFYSHWGIYIGNGEIVHVGGNKGEKAKVKLESFWDAVKDGLAKKNNSRDADWSVLPVEVIIKNAKNRVGNWDYNLLSENCEHLVNWCRYNVFVSDQVENLQAFLIVTGVSVAVISTSILVGSLLEGGKKRNNPQ